MLFIDFALFGAVGVVIWALQMIWIPFWAAGFVNGIGHWWGYRNFESADTSTNVSPGGFWIAAKSCTTIITRSRARRSSRCASGNSISAGPRFACSRSSASRTCCASRRRSDLRPNVHLPDGDTVKALLAHRFHVMSDYFRGVIVPTLREDAANAVGGVKSLPRKLRKGARQRRPLARRRVARAHGCLHAESSAPSTVCEFRARLAALTERPGRNGDALLDGVRQWCHEAEATGIRTLQEFAMRPRVTGSSAKPAERVVPIDRKPAWWRAFFWLILQRSIASTNASRVRSTIASAKAVAPVLSLTPAVAQGSNPFAKSAFATVRAREVVRGIALVECGRPDDARADRCRVSAREIRHEYAARNLDRSAGHDVEFRDEVTNRCVDRAVRHCAARACEIDRAARPRQLAAQLGTAIVALPCTSRSDGSRDRRPGEAIIAVEAPPMPKDRRLRRSTGLRANTRCRSAACRT